MFKWLNGRDRCKFYAETRRFTPQFDISLHRICTAKMASIRKQKSGAWRVQVRRKGRSVSENFIRYEDAKRWAVDAERQIDRGEAPATSRIGKLKTFGELIDLHIEDMKDVGKAPGRSKDATLQMLKRQLGKLTLPMSRIVRFAIATAMRQEEICRVTWSDFNARTKMLTIRDRKDPRAKKGNDQRIPLLAASGYDAVALIEEQRAIRGNEDDRIFPYNHRSMGTSFTRAVSDLGIEDLHFHDLRHEGTSRLFEANYRIEQVALVTGHKDWKMLRRYTHLRPESLHDLPPTRAA
jgi:integrase